MPGITSYPTSYRTVYRTVYPAVTFAALDDGSVLRTLPGRKHRARPVPRYQRAAHRPARRLPRSVCRWPRSARRGLGLFDAILAAAVLSLMLLWGGQIVGDWARERVVAGEARTVADLARAGRLLLEGDVTHAGRSHGVGAAPLSVTFADLETAGLRAAASGSRTPGRRTLSLHLWRPSNDALVVIARARGARPLARLPGAENGVSGVGLLRTGETRLRGSGVDFDMGPLDTALPGFATVNDLFALDYVALDAACRDYLFRVAVTGCPDANTMATDLDLGGNDLTTTGTLTATAATIGTLQGATEVTGALTAGGDLSVTGATDLQDLTVTGALTAGTVGTTGTLTARNLTATGGITGANLTINGTVTVSGEARLGAATADALTVETLNVRQLSSDEGTFDQILANDVTATSCTGCD